jgi:hypothetical protein
MEKGNTKHYHMNDIRQAKFTTAYYTIQGFWDATPCRRINNFRRLEGWYCVYIPLGWRQRLRSKCRELLTQQHGVTSQKPWINARTQFQVQKGLLVRLYQLNDKTRQAVLYVLRNTEERSCNHCCSGKPIRIAYSVCVCMCVCVALGIQRAMCMRHSVSWGLPASTIFVHIIS